LRNPGSAPAEVSTSGGQNPFLVGQNIIEVTLIERFKPHLA
jgi:hypothetical protein